MNIGELSFRTRILSLVNRLNYKFTANKVGSVIGYRDQWLLSISINDDFTKLKLTFCQGRNIGRITHDGAYPVFIDVSDKPSNSEVIERIKSLDNKYPKRNWLIYI